MNLRSAFMYLLDYTPLDGDLETLLAYAEEDHAGGRDTGEYPVEVSINTAEGKLIYALMRHLRPGRALEIGTADGCSAVHMLTALNANRFGRLTSIDIDARAGRMISAGLRSRWDFICADATEVALPAAQLVFEDGQHDYTSTLLTLTRLKAINPKVVISHDYYRHLYDTNVQVKRAFDEVFGDEAIGIHFDDTRTGLGVWVRA